jgi:hypothetical protein
MKPYMVLSALSLTILLSGCDTYPDIADDNGPGPTPDSETNDTFFNADSLDSNTVSGTLSNDNLTDYYKTSSALFNERFNGQMTITLTGTGGNADIELFDSNLNLISWSRTEDSSEEEIIYWYSGAADSHRDVDGQHYILVSTPNGDTSDYTLTFTFN